MEDGRQNKQGIYADAYASPPGRIKTNKKYESSTFSYSKNQNFDSRAADLGDCIPGDRLSPFRKRQSSESKHHYSSEHNAFRNKSMRNDTESDHEVNNNPFEISAEVTDYPGPNNRRRRTVEVMRINRNEGRLSLEGPKPVNINIKPR